MLPWARTAPCVGYWQPSNSLGLLYIKRWSSAQSEQPEYDYEAARDWFKNKYSADTLSKLGEVTYSRSSGPGGQNVNKCATRYEDDLFLWSDHLQSQFEGTIARLYQPVVPLDPLSHAQGHPLISLFCRKDFHPPHTSR